MESELVLGLQKCMQAGEVHSVPAEMGLGVLCLHAQVISSLHAGLVQPDQQVPDIKLGLRAFH